MKIKAIAFDMDGTLLDDNKQLPSNFNILVNQLRQLEIELIVASGRQYRTLQEGLKENQDVFTYISDNGTLVYQGNQTILEIVMNRNVALEVIGVAQQQLNVTLIVSCVDGAYMLERDYQQFKEEMAPFYSTIKIVSDFKECPDFCKIALFNRQGQHGSVHLLASISQEIRVVTSGLMWIDVFPREASKGQALEKVCELKGIHLSEVMAFGDEMNDYEMLKMAGISIAMENARPEIKQIAMHITDHHDRQGVAKVLEKVIEQKGVWNEKNINLF